MELWFSDYHTEDVKLDIKIEKQLFGADTDFQRIDVFESKEFYGNCFRALKEDGIMVYQHGSPFYDEDEETCRAMHRKASHSFPISRVYQAHIPTCPSGYWLFGFASKKYHPLKDFDAKKWLERGIKTWYYSEHLHKGAFMLPKYVEDMLEEEER